MVLINLEGLRHEDLLDYKSSIVDRLCLGITHSLMRCGWSPATTRITYLILSGDLAMRSSL